MPLLTRLFIKSSLVYLALALLVGVWIATSSLSGNIVPGLFPVYLHLFVVGWLSLLIFGVAYWMFPKYSPSRPRGSEGLAWATFILAHLGLILRAIAEPPAASNPASFWGWMLALSALSQWLSGLLFVLNTWSRVKEK